MNNDFSLSNAKGKNSVDSTTSSFKSKRPSFRNKPAIVNQIKNKNINALLKRNLSRNVQNLPICISQVTNLKNFHHLSNKLSQKDVKNNSLSCHSKENLFAKEDSFKDNNKIYNFKTPKQSKNITFNKYISRNKNCLVINDLLLNPSFDNFYKNITPKNNEIKSDKENSPLLLKLSPIKPSSLKRLPIIHSLRVIINNKIKQIKQKYLLNNINNNSTTIDKNLSDINIIPNKTKSIDELNALSSFDLYGNNIINITNNNIDFKINNTIKNYSNLKYSFNKNKKMNKIIKNKNLFTKLNKSLLEDKNNEKKNFQNKLFSLAHNDSKINQNKKLNKLIFDSNKLAEKNKVQIQSNINRNERENKEENDSSFFLNQEKSNIFQTTKNNWERNNKTQKEIIQENILNKKHNSLNKTNLNETKTNININNENLNKTVNNNENLNKTDNNNDTLDKSNNNNKIANKTENNNETLDKSDNNNKILNKTDNNNENSIKKDNNNEILNKIDNNNENKEKDINNVVQDVEIRKSCFSKDKKNENKKIKLNIEKKKSSKSIIIDNDKNKLGRKKTFFLKDYNEMKKKYAKIIIDSNKSFLENNEFLNEFYKNVDKDYKKINKKIVNTKIGFLHLNESQIESSIIKEYNIFKNKISTQLQFHPKERKLLNIKVLKNYNQELKDILKKHKDSIYEYKYKFNNIGNSLKATKYHFDHIINKNYEFDSFDSLKTKRNINSRRRSLTYSLDEIKKIQYYIKRTSLNSLPDNSFHVLKTKPLYFKNEIEWKNSNTNFLWIYKFIMKDHYLDLNEEYPSYYKYKDDESFGDIKRKKCLKKIVSDNNIPGFKTLIRKNSIIHFSPSTKTKSFSRSPSFIDLSAIRSNSFISEKKKERPKNINDFSLLSIKKFYLLKENSKMKKFLEKDSLLDIEEVDDDINNDESEDNKNIPFILQIKESDYQMINKGEFLLENSRTIEDIYIGLCFLIVEGKEKLFINKLKELKNDIDINNQMMEGNTFLIISTREGNKNITKFLCQQGCEINIQNFKGNTALHYAIANLFFEIVDILISYGAKEDIINNFGLRPWECIDNNLE